MLIGRRALLNYGQSMSDRKHDKYLRISHRVRSPIRSANNHSNSMLCIMNLGGDLSASLGNWQPIFWLFILQCSGLP